MRILQVLAGLGVGGAERLAGSLSACLQQQGHEVAVVNLTSERHLVPIIERDGMQVVQVSDWGPWTRVYPPQLTGLVRRWRPHVLHCHNMAWLKTAAAGRWTGTPCVFTLHSYHDRWLREHRRWLRLAANYTDFCVGVAPGVERLFVDILGYPSERAVYIRNGTPDIYLPDPPPPQWGVSLPSWAPVIGMVGRFDLQHKDQGTLIRALRIVRLTIPDAQLVFIGDGPNRATMEQLAEELGLSNCVHFLGFREDVSVLLHHLDVFVLSSRIEGESIAVLEAMSAQRPIVATAVGGTPGLLANGECGLLVPPEDPQAMAEAIVQLLQNQEKAQELAQRARQRFLEEYTIERMGNRYVELYERALQERRRI